MRLFCTIIVLAISWESFSQANVPTVIQPSPNAASLGKYGDIPVSYHSGVPNIDVPLHEVNEGAIKLPISLSYHSSGVRVSEVSSWVGLGWALNAGGAITRSVQQVPDEGPTKYTFPDSRLNFFGAEKNFRSGYYKDGYILSNNLSFESVNSDGYFTDLAEAKNHNIFLDACLGNIDTEPDIFFFNFAGYSGKFLFDVDKNAQGQFIRNAVFVPEADIKVDVTFSNLPVPGLPPENTTPRVSFVSFLLTTPDGFKYTFGGSSAIEFSASQTYNMASHENLGYPLFLPTAWYLTRVESPDGKFISLEYVPDTYGFFDLAGEQCWQAEALFNLGSQMITRTAINGVRLLRISTSNEEILFQANTIREDLSDYANSGGVETMNNVTTKRLDRITVQQRSGQVVKKFDFNYSYFLCSDSRLPQFLEESASRPYFVSDKKRLKLESITQKSGDGSITLPPYSFQYNETTLPRRMSFQQDHWGYYNGVSSNRSLIPYTVRTTEPRNANRTTDPQKMKAGILNSIQYPTGGKTTFTFEANEYVGPVTANAPYQPSKYSASTTWSASQLAEVITPFEIQPFVPEPNSTCMSGGSECYSFTVDMSITNGDPHINDPNGTVYDHDYSIYMYDIICAVYNENDQVVHALFGGDLSCTQDPTYCVKTTMNGATTLRREVDVDLPPGKYYLKATRITGPKRGDPSKNVMYFSSISVTLPADADANFEPPVVIQSAKAGGLRVARITNTEGIQNNIVSDKIYNYNGSGKLFGKPTYFYSVRYTRPAEIAGWEGYGVTSEGAIVTQLWSSSSIIPMRNTQGSHLGYALVRETTEGNGYTEYNYDVQDHRYIIFDDPYFLGDSYDLTSSFGIYNYPPKPPLHAYERGNLLKVEHFNEADVRLTKTLYDYEIGHTTLKMRGTKVGFVNYTVYPGGGAPPVPVSMISYFHYPIFTATSRLLNTRETTYDKFGANPLTVVTENIYGSQNHLLVTEQKKTFNTYQQTEKYIYPPDYGQISSTVAGIKNLQQRHIINVPIEKYTVLQNNDGTDARVSAGTLTLYKPDLPFVDAVHLLALEKPLPLGAFNYSNKIVNQFNLPSGYESRLTFQSYDARGNVKEVSKTNDARMAYIWSHNSTLPIAEVKNADAASISFTSFESGINDGNWTFAGSISNASIAKSGKYVYTLTSTTSITRELLAGKFKLEYFAKTPVSVSVSTGGTVTDVFTSPADGNGWVLYRKELNLATGVTLSISVPSGSALIDEVRLHPVGSSMTTYSYDPPIGMSSATDSNCVTTYYEYDRIGRLNLARDDKGNIVNQYKYHYADQE